MSQSVQMPALGESVTEGTVTRWLKNEGDRVEVDEPLVEVSTDKVDTEIPSPFAGVLEKILVQVDETAPVGGELARIGDGSGGGSAPAAPAAAPAEAPEVPSTEAPAPGEAPVAQPPAPAPEPPTAPQSGGGGGGSGTQVKLPEMGESVTEGTVTRWLKKVGDSVALDEALVEVSTDKVDTEVPSPVAGTLLSIAVNEDETVQVGGVLAVIGDASAAAAPAQTPAPAPAPAAAAPAPAPAPAAPPAAAKPAPAEAPPAPAPTPAQAPAVAGDAPKPAWQPAPPPAGTYITPVIRKLAADNGIDLNAVTGTGVGGRIRREDISAAVEAKASAEAAAAAKPAASGTPAAASAPSKSAQPSEAAKALIGTTQKLPRIRQAIAKNMLHGLQTAAQLTTVIEVDASRIAALRAKAKNSFQAREGVGLSFLPFFVKAAIEALKLYPVINSSLADDLKEITYHGNVNLGIAVDTPRGLLVPVIKGADDLNIPGIARKIADLAARTRDNKINPDELAGGTFTVTNTGSVGALFDTPIFVPPQSAILGTGAIVKRPVVAKDADGNEVIAIRSMCYLAMSYDHRNIDGADASRFLGAVKARIEGGDFAGDVGL